MTPPTPTSPHDLWIAKLHSIGKLSPAEESAIRSVPLTLSAFAQGANIFSEGDRVSRCALLVEGFLYRFKAMPNGQRQIMSFHVPGDMGDLETLHLPLADHSLGTLAPSTVAFITHAALAELIAGSPGLGAALWRDTLIDASVFRQWIANVGRRTSVQRVAHILCETVRKLEAVGLAANHRAPFPITSAELADATGLSVVDVNRALQRLETEGLATLSGGILSISNWTALKQAGDFDPAYLHLSDQEGE